MKDPLQKEQTAYEILDLEPGASDSDIDKAFKTGLVQRKNPQKLNSARNILQRQDERAMLDLFYYDPGMLSSLRPNPVEDGTVLNPINRMATASVWESRLKSDFPDFSVVQTLGVFWYWWAVHEEERMADLLRTFNGQGKGKTGTGSKHDLLRAVRKAEGISCNPEQSESCIRSDCGWISDCTSSAPPTEQMWQRVVACWVTLAVNLKNWDGANRVSDSTRDQLRQSLEKKLRNHFHDLGQQYRTNGFTALADRYQKLDLDLTTELQTAKEVANIGLRNNRGEISCGRLMLDQVGMLSLIQNKVNVELKKTPASKSLIKLRNALSDYSSIAILIDNHKPDDALSAIADLPAEQQKKPELMRLKAKALMERGRQQDSLGNINQALDAWKTALSTSSDNELREEIRSLIVSSCGEQAAKLRQHRRDEAIGLLQSGLHLVKDENLQLALADLLTERGVEVCVKVQKQAEKESRALTGDLLAAFEGGLADLDRAAGLGSSRAKEQADVARNVLEQARIGQEFVLLLNRVNEAAQRADWDTAVQLLKEAIFKAGSNAPPELKKMLATFLGNRAVERVNQAVAGLPNGTMSQEAAYSALQGAQSDLTEAIAFDPTNAQLRENLTTVNNLVAQLDVARKLNPNWGTPATPSPYTSPYASTPKPAQPKPVKERPLSYYSSQRRPIFGALLMLMFLGVFPLGFSDSAILKNFFLSRGEVGKYSLLIGKYMWIGISWFIVFAAAGTQFGFVKLFWQEICRSRWRFMNWPKRIIELILYLAYLPFLLTVLAKWFGFRQ